MIPLFSLIYLLLIAVCMFAAIRVFRGQQAAITLLLGCVAQLSVALCVQLALSLFVNASTAIAAGWAAGLLVFVDRFLTPLLERLGFTDTAFRLASLLLQLHQRPGLYRIRASIY